MNRLDLPELAVKILRPLSLFIGVPDLILTAHSYSTLYSEEVFFCTIVVITFVCSFMLLIAHLLRYISDETLKVKYFDAWFHVLGCVVVLIGGMFMMSAAMDRPATIASINTERVFAAFLGMVNGLIYGTIGYLLYKKLPSGPAHVKHGEGLEWEDPLLLSQESRKPDFGTMLT